MNTLTKSWRKLPESKIFQCTVFTAIVVGGILVGLETYLENNQQFYFWLKLVEDLVFGLLISEFVIKLCCQSKPLEYFKDGWNIFDFTILVFLILLYGNHYVGLLRIVRLLRTLKLLTIFPALREVLLSLYRSLPAFGSVLIILGVLFFGYGVLGYSLFSANDPVHFESLHISWLSLFRVITLEDWTDIMYIQMYGCSNYGYGGIEHLCTNSQAFPLISPLFFTSFVFLGSIIVVNLFVGIFTGKIIESMENHLPSQSEHSKKN